ncbi:chlorophyll synthase ChlG [Falsiroseomonas sp. HW251]|uniref:chlorophyll synthase ChlG n=1 Tax=Falsiroseomonas sp. HW251 TaxID=3390998 RepID=UPI003D313BAA
MADPANLTAGRQRRYPAPSAVLEILKPITWFPPMWAFGCGIVASGASLAERWPYAVLGILLAGPLVCGMSQAVNDWFDRHVDAINEPHRAIPSGRMPGRWGLHVAIVWTGLSLLVGGMLGPWGFAATVLACISAWIYSAPPLRLKGSGIWGPLACGISYESLPWITGAAVLSGAAPDPRVVAIALLYGVAAHGIMTINDFKSIEGDRRFGLRSLPVMLGPERAALAACWMMAVPQMVVIGLLLGFGHPIAAAIVTVVLALQGLSMRKWLTDPRGLAPWYNGAGVTLFVTGMMACSVALAP